MLKSRIGTSVKLNLPTQVQLGTEYPTAIGLRVSGSLEEPTLLLSQHASLKSDLLPFNNKISQEENENSHKETFQETEKEDEPMAEEVPTVAFIFSPKDINDPVVHTSLNPMQTEDIQQKRAETSYSLEAILRGEKHDKEEEKENNKPSSKKLTPIKATSSTCQQPKTGGDSAQHSVIHNQAFYNHNSVLASFNLEELDFTESYFVRKRKGAKESLSKSDKSKKKPQVDECCICYGSLYSPSTPQR